MITVDTSSYTNIKPCSNLSLNSYRERGRPRVSYENASNLTKKRRVTEIQSSFSQEQLKDAANSLINNRINDEESVKEIDNVEISDKALAMFMDLQLSKGDYENLRKHNENVCNSKIYPPYSHIQEAKKRCYPVNIHLTDRKAWVDLQSLLDHTTNRLLLSVDKQKMYEFCGESLTFHIKWGMDGASGQQIIKQKWQNNESLNSADIDLSEESVFQVSIVPLELGTDDKILWKNERPSSTRYCRPVKYEFTKETSQNTLDEYNYYNNLIKQLKPLTVNVFKRHFKVIYNMKCTMIDGKICNVLTDQLSSNCCNICLAKPSEINNLDYVNRLPTKDEYFHLGLHPLHCRIRFLEHIWHVACNLDFKEYQAKGSNKEIKLAKKLLLQQRIKSSLGLNIDVVKRGYGTTNDGNTSRRFFASPDVISKITEIDKNLIERYNTILQVLNCGYKIDIGKFKEYANETAQLYVKLYDWYPMPPSVHKVLIHGWRIIESFGLPIGCLSEEAQEANNKVFKQARANNARMCSRQKCNEDVMHYLLVSSDPHISNLRIRKEKKPLELSKETKKLICL